MPKKFDSQHGARRHQRVELIRSKTQDTKSFDFGKLNRKVWNMWGETDYNHRTPFRETVRLVTEHVALFCMRRHGITGRKLRQQILDETKLYLSTIEAMRQIRTKKPYATGHNHKAYAQYAHVEKLTKDRLYSLLGSNAEIYLFDIHSIQRRMLDLLGLL